MQIFMTLWLLIIIVEINHIKHRNVYLAVSTSVLSRYIDIYKIRHKGNPKKILSMLLRLAGIICIEGLYVIFTLYTLFTQHWVLGVIIILLSIISTFISWKKYYIVDALLSIISIISYWIYIGLT